MSYDLYLLPERSGEDPIDTLERLEEANSAHSPEDEMRVQRLGAALRAAIPTLEDNAGDAAGSGEVHLMDADGLEVSIYHHSGSVSFPYWDSLDTTALVGNLDRVATVVGAHTDWRMYDPQQEAWIDPLRDADEFRAAFGHGRNIIREMAAEDAAPTLPWWRRLFTRSS